MRVLMALLGTILIFAVAAFLTWLTTKYNWGVIAVLVVTFMTIFVVLLSYLS